MNPIPLAAPDGQVYAYACASCRHVSATSQLLCPPEHDGPFPELVRASLDGALHCCTCMTCGQPLPRREAFSVTCDRCRAWWIFVNNWTVLAAGYVPAEPGSTKPKLCAICHGAETHYCRATPACASCGDGHGGGRDNLCRDCSIAALWHHEYDNTEDNQ